MTIHFNFDIDSYFDDLTEEELRQVLREKVGKEIGEQYGDLIAVNRDEDFIPPPERPETRRFKASVTILPKESVDDILETLNSIDFAEGPEHTAIKSLTRRIRLLLTQL